MDFHDGHAIFGPPGKPLIHQLCADAVCRIDNLASSVTNRDWWWKKLEEIHAVSTSWYLIMLKDALPIATFTYD